jgi:hypothetical protein
MRVKMKKMNANIIGNKTVQHVNINWSYRIRGKEALIQINKNTKRAVLIPKNNPLRKFRIIKVLSKFKGLKRISKGKVIKEVVKL